MNLTKFAAMFGIPKQVRASPSVGYVNTNVFIDEKRCFELKSNPLTASSEDIKNLCSETLRLTRVERRYLAVTARLKKTFWEHLTEAEFELLLRQLEETSFRS
jgi:hypothetical protein